LKSLIADVFQSRLIQQDDKPISGFDADVVDLF